MCVWKWQPNRRTASWSYARLCDIDTHINSLENISHTQWDSWFLLISSNIATIPCQIPEHTTAFVGFHVFPCLPQRGRVAPSERSRLPLRGLVLSTWGGDQSWSTCATWWIQQIWWIGNNADDPNHLWSSPGQRQWTSWQTSRIPWFPGYWQQPVYLSA